MPARRPSPLALASVLAAASFASGCVRDNNATTGKTPAASTEQTRVGNNDPRGVDDQPDWEQQARELKQRVDPRMPTTLAGDHEAACVAMLEAAQSFYVSVEADPEIRERRLDELRSTHAADLASCKADISEAAAVCVTILLGDRDAEFPWLLDQCVRAYPKGAGGGSGAVVGQAAPAPAAAPERAESIELTFVGDVIFGRYREDNRFDPIIEGEAEALAEAGLSNPFTPLETQLASDVLVGNLETPVIEDLPEVSPIGAKFRFGGDRDMVRVLGAAGFDVLSLANNHYFDLREDGQLQSPTILREEGITAIGESVTEGPEYRVVTHEAKGWKIGFLAVTNRVNAPVREGRPKVPYIILHDMVDTLGPILAAARADHDLLVVAVHWGDEYADKPNVYQQKVARALIEGGVDLVVGHHPHVLQGIERHEGGLIAYSMGNFLFENTTEIPRLTGVLRTRWMDTQTEGAVACLDHVVFHPAYVKRQPYPHPAPATGYMGKQVRGRVVSQAKALGTTFEQQGEDLEVAGLGCKASEDGEDGEAG
ncbi:capsule biosynthesis protein, putative [Plesiocystis pacifica SIR-1]|uniref:Capsule biosynthesis protein, putative n=1 Tax=Plesiocystis pacifica SIR-1 TaxID=391625 RepID=A6GHV7_9BACT|nr:CapA family protein [Plesiocystis pacifica]EDM74554.1 capsule biosynthesis protein, putative [Plesiocystis pacifica SIR-1]